MTDTCDRCGAPLEIGMFPFCKGNPADHGRGFPNVVDDSIPGGMTIENLSATPLTFYSKSDWRREMKARGYVNRVEHVPVPGSDKSPQTTRWI